MTSNLKRSVVSFAVIMAFASARADEVRSTTAANDERPRQLASVAVQPKAPTQDREVARGGGEPSRVGLGARDDGRTSDAAIEEPNHQRFLHEVWRATP